MKSIPQPEHWSKDYVEHLRTVHFALVTVSVGLILLLSSKPYDVQKAQVQLEEILQLKSWWSHDGLHANFDPFGSDMRYTPNALGLLQKYDDSSKPVAPLPQEFEAGFDSRPKRNITFVLPQANWYWCHRDDSGPPPNVFVDPGAPRTFPNRMRDVRQWWTSLAKEYSVYSVDDVLPVGVGEYSVPGSEGIHEATLTIGHVNGDHAENERRQLSLTQPCEGTDSFLSGTDTHRPMHAFRFRIQHLTGVLMSQRILHKRFQDLTPGPFEKTFSDLIEATRGRWDIDLGLLQNKISEEAAKGPEVFEAFGLKFPAEQVSSWGIIVLLSVQLYLVLYLKKLSNKLEADAPGWDVPWIAMDHSGGAQMVVFATFVVLPFVAALFTIGQFTWLSLLTTISSLLASTVLCVLSWIYRPRPKEPVEPAVALYW